MNKNIYDFACFKEYDIRGQYPNQVNEKLAYQIGLAIVNYLETKNPIVIGADMRLSSSALKKSIIEGITDAGADVIDIGVVITDMVYFAVGKLKAAGGIMVTASHNPKDDNGFKFVREEAMPIYSKSLLEIKEIIESGKAKKVLKKGSLIKKDITSIYIKHVLGFIDSKKIGKFEIVADAGNGVGGLIVKKIIINLPGVKIIPLNFKPDGHFPNGVPNPLLPENRHKTIAAVKKYKADLGVAWDGDADRVFFYDEKGNFVESYYLISIFANYFLKKNPGAKIIHELRLTWATIETTKNAGGKPVQSRAGHAFIKAAMRENKAIYGGEMSGHHYFRDNYYADNGMIPFIILLAVMSEQKKSLSELILSFIKAHPISGEINFEANYNKVLVALKKEYATKAKKVDCKDGISCEFAKWRFNIRPSQTEPLVRLNIETDQDLKLLKEKTNELSKFIKERG